MKKNVIKSSLVLFAGLALTSCSKDNEVTPISPAELQTTILTETANKVIEAAYVDMHEKTAKLHEATVLLSENPTEEELTKARELWKAVRSTWEKSEAFLFGPIASESIDPRIDTWPIDMNGVQGILAGSEELTQEFINSLADSQKGFHPIEFLLWGQEGNKTAADFTPREMDYLVALSENLNTLAEEVKNSWLNGYTETFITAGNGSAIYETQQEALVALIDGMAGICDEVAAGKIDGPFAAQDPSQSESPFSKNSITDFTNNIKGVMAIYKGEFAENGKGMEDLVRLYNTQLDGQIKAAHQGAITALEAIQIPFGEAIISKPNKVQNAIDKINALKAVLENDLLLLVQKHAK